MSQGVTGYVSDRAWEIDAEVYGSVDAQPSAAGNDRSAYLHTSVDQKITDDLEQVATILQSEGRPLLLERARVDFDVARTTSAQVSGRPVAWHARVQSLATHFEVPTGLAAYTNDARAQFHLPPPDAFRSRPGYAQLAADGVLRVGVLFGQMSKGDLVAEDDGQWSRTALEKDLAANGYKRIEPQDTAWTRWEKTLGSLRVHVDVGGPETFPLLGDEAQARATLRSFVAGHEFVYLNGHANQPSLDALGDPRAFEPAAYRILMFDVCWSYFLYTRPALDAAPWGQTHVVNASGRVVTGSVESFSLMLHGVAKATAAAMQNGEAESPSWIELLQPMNQQASARARVRRGKVIADLEPPEIYGVSGVWNPNEIMRAEPIAEPIAQKQ
jgi:hypothetical protein